MISGVCEQAKKTARGAMKDRLRRAAAFHRACRGYWPGSGRCTCACHRREQRASVEQRLEKLKASRLA